MSIRKIVLWAMDFAKDKKRKKKVLHGPWTVKTKQYEKKGNSTTWSRNILNNTKKGNRSNKPIDVLSLFLYIYRRYNSMAEVSKYSLPKQTGLTSSKVYPVLPYTFQDDTLTLPYSMTVTP